MVKYTLTYHNCKHLYTSSRQNIHSLQTADTEIQHCIQYITNITHSVLIGDVNAHSTLWHSYTDDHKEQLIADVISNSDHITQTRTPNTTVQYNKHHQISPRCLIHCTTRHHGQINMHYHQTTYPSSLQLTYSMIMTTNYNKPDGRSPTTRMLTNHGRHRVRFRSDHHTTNIHTANIIFTNIILMADKHTIPKGDA